MQQGCAIVPKSSNRERQQQNADVLDWSLSDKAMAALDGLGSRKVEGGAGPEQNCMIGWAREHDPDHY